MVYLEYLEGGYWYWHRYFRWLDWTQGVPELGLQGL